MLACFRQSAHGSSVISTEGSSSCMYCLSVASISSTSYAPTVLTCFTPSARTTGSISMIGAAFFWSVRPVPGLSWWPVMPVTRLSMMIVMIGLWL